MGEEPRYREDEVREIFERAAVLAEGSARGASEGLTLAELQAIGREVGLAPDRIAEAASALELRRGTLPRRTVLGIPISVGRTVALPRAPDDREWEVLVAELRQTFRARGKERSSGGLRQWTNGNLFACIEPADSGYRLRMGTTRSNGAALTYFGAGAIAVAIMLMLLSTFMPLDQGFSDLLVLALGGTAAIGYNALRLPPWAAEREAQMEHIGARARALLDVTADHRT